MTNATTHQLSLAGSTVSSSPQAQDIQPFSTVLGIDSLTPSSASLVANARSTDYLGRTPAFWGRYFYAPGQINSLGEKDTHYAPTENAMLRGQGIRVLPIARQTGNVGQASKAQNDAIHNVAAIFEAFPASYLSGADPNVLVFLDVEKHTPMAADYYETWSATVISEAARISNQRVGFHPAVYGSQGDDVTWAALKRAMDSGAPCDGVLVARYYYPTPAPRPWDDALTTPSVALHCPILCWQYWASPDDAPETTNFDTSLANPAHADILISRLVMPPG